MKTFAIRGATTIETDSAEEITAKSVELIEKIIEANNITGSETISLIVSTTEDIHSFYPVAAIRKSGKLNVPFFSTVEPRIDNSLKLCIRYMLTVEKDNDFIPKHIYLHGAAVLRPDLN